MRTLGALRNAAPMRSDPTSQEPTVNLDTVVAQLSADITRRAIEGAIASVNAAFDNITLATPVVTRPTGDSAKAMAAIAANPGASIREIALAAGLDFPRQSGLIGRVRTRFRSGVPAAKRGRPRDDNSAAAKIRRAIAECGPSASNPEIAAAAGVDYLKHVRAISLWRRAAGFPPLKPGPKPMRSAAAQAA